MKSKDCIDLSIYIITEYYKNNLQPYFEYADEDISWHGPAYGQYLRGRNNVIAAWSKEENPLTFSMGNIEAHYTSTNSSFCEVMLMYVVTTYYPSGRAIPIFQRLHLTWCERKVTDKLGTLKKVPRLLMVHISNPVYQHENDKIYPVHFDEVYTPSYAEKGDHRLRFNCADKSVRLIYINSIQWIETLRTAQHCIIHSGSGSIEVADFIGNIEKCAEGKLVRIHTSYLVNPLFVQSIKRCYVIMKDGTELRIPEKKYTSVKRTLVEMMNKM